MIRRFIAFLRQLYGGEGATGYTHDKHGNMIPYFGPRRPGDGLLLEVRYDG